MNLDNQPEWILHSIGYECPDCGKVVIDFPPFENVAVKCSDCNKWVKVSKEIANAFKD